MHMQIFARYFPSGQPLTHYFVGEEIGKIKVLRGFDIGGTHALLL